MIARDRRDRKFCCRICAELGEEYVPEEDRITYDKDSGSVGSQANVSQTYLYFHSPLERLREQGKRVALFVETLKVMMALGCRITKER